MEYTIDLCSFNIEAESEEDAYKTARKMIKKGDIRIDRIFLNAGE